ncbi:methyl-accepting chemotaxis protein [Belnapia moabensis]|uniref:methyl-accepting chemotaxis protein n=1 Tax=Belnapia moabensis TaxID=365533 RepID=UPI0014706070|nr:methyl-accepting chemotaxis protein [Belnapia moabensis]
MNLPIGRKLAASVILAIVLLAGMIGLVRVLMDGAKTQQAAERAASAAQLAAQQAATHVARTAIAVGEVLMAQTPEATERGIAQVNIEVRAAKAHLKAAADVAVDRAVGAKLAEANQQLENYSISTSNQALLRKQLIAERDGKLQNISNEYDQLYDSVSSLVEIDVPAEMREDARQRLAALHLAVNDVRLGSQRFLATGDGSQARRVRRAAAQLRVHQRAVAAIQVAANAAADLRRISATGEAVAASAVEVVRLAEAAQAEHVQRGTPSRENLEAAVAAANSLLHEEAEYRAAASAITATEIERGVLWIGAAVALILVIFGWINARIIGAPLRRLVSAIRRIAEGDASVVVPDRNRSDEIGNIAAALQDLCDAAGRAFAQQQMLQQIPVAVMTTDATDNFRINYMNPASMKVLTVIEDQLPCKVNELPGKSIDIMHDQLQQQRVILTDPARLPHKDRIRLGEEVLDLSVSAIRNRDGEYISAMLVWSLATAQARLADSFEAEIGGVVEAVATAAVQVQAAARTLSLAAETSGRQAEAVAMAANQAGTDVQSVAASADELAASVAEVSRQVADGAAVAQAAATEARATDELVQSLAQAAQRIGDVVRLIGDIAGQTNLLALNATIEAARAGEAGKGFAVVATEVKQLAGQTAKATEEIATQISSIQTATEQAVHALRSIGGTVGRINVMTAAIAAAVEEQGSATQEIARSASQVAVGTNAVVSRIQEVQRAAQETGDASAGLLGASSKLNSHAGTLRQRSAEFLAGVRRA